MLAEPLNATRALTRGFFQLYPDEAARVLDALPAGEIIQLLEAEPGDRAAEIFARLNLDIATNTIEQMDENLFRDLFTRINPVRGAMLMARMDAETAGKRLNNLPAGIASELRELLSYPPDSAGNLMDPRVTTFHPNMTIEETLAHIRMFHERRILDLCIVDAAGHLTAVVPLQEVAGAQPTDRLGDLARNGLTSIQATSPRDEVVALIETRKLSSLPVVDFEGKLLGIIRHDALVNAAKQDASEDMQAMVGAGREERALSKATFAIQKRLPWLQINLGTAFLAAFVVGLFEDTIAKYTALAILLPVVAGQSGNTGAQALAVTMRGLALREIRISSWLRVMRKEFFVGFVNGCAVALTTSLAVYIFMDSPGLALVIGVSMVFSMIGAGLAGAVIPVILTALKQDPAQSASIILTTVTDVVGFLSFLGLATVLTSLFQLAL